LLAGVAFPAHAGMNRIDGW